MSDLTLALPAAYMSENGQTFHPVTGMDVRNFIKHFRREEAGVWTCLEYATLDMPQGRVQVNAGTRFTVGTKFMNIDLAHMLDEEYSRSRP